MLEPILYQQAYFSMLSIIKSSIVHRYIKLKLYKTLSLDLSLFMEVKAGLSTKQTKFK